MNLKIPSSHSSGLITRIPPHNLDAERAVLGAVLIDNTIMALLTEAHISWDMFYVTAHQMIYTAMNELYAHGQPIDYVTLSEELQKHNHLNMIGGPLYLKELEDSTASTANALYYANIVKDKATLREIIVKANSILSYVYYNEDSADISAILSKIKEEVYNLGIGVYDDDKLYLSTLKDEVLKLKDSPIVGETLPTGLVSVDQRLAGGLMKAELTVVGGRPGLGKSALAMQIATNIALQGKKTLVFSVEMPKHTLAQRYVANKMRISVSQIRSGDYPGASDPEHWDAPDELANVIIYDKVLMTIEDIIDTAKAINRTFPVGAGIDAIVVDYIHRLAEDKRKVSGDENDVAFLGRIAKGLKNLARDMNIAMLAVSQLSRGADRGNVSLGHLRGSGIIEQEADVVLLLEAIKTLAEQVDQVDQVDYESVEAEEFTEDEADEFDPNKASPYMLIKIEKGRNIPKCAIPYIFEGKYMNFREPSGNEMSLIMMACQARNVFVSHSQPAKQSKVDKTNKIKESATTLVDEDDIPF